MPRAIFASESFLRFSLGLMILSTPLLAASPVAVGLLRCEGDVYLGSNQASSETALYVGDRLRTQEGRAAVKFLGGDLVDVDGHSNLAIRIDSGGILIGLEKGQIAWTATTPRATHVEIAGLDISSDGFSPSLAEIALRNNGSVVVAVERGNISVSHLKSEPVIVRAGRVLTVNPSVEDSKGQNVGTGAHGEKSLAEKIRTFRIDGLSSAGTTALLVGGVVAGGTAALVIANQTASPSKP